LNCLPSFLRALALLACVAAIGGCAAQSAYRDGQDLVRQGRVVEGLAKLDEAQRLDPTVASYRAAAIQTRERWLASLLDKAEESRRLANFDAAERAYREVLALHGSNDRALAGLRWIDQRRRADTWLKDAEAVAGKDPEQARVKLKAILLEEPSHERARNLLQRLDRALPKPNPESALAAAYRKPITIEFKDVPLRTVFEVISRSSGLNFLFDKDVRSDQKTSIFLKNATIESAVNLTLLTNQLDQRVIDANTVLIYPNTQAKQKDYQPLTVRSFYLANAEAKTVGASLKTMLKVRDVVVDDKLNLLIVRDSPEAIRLAEKLVALHDVAEPEVMLEVEILEVKRTRLLDLGIRWPDQLSLSPIASGAGGLLTLADLRNVNSASMAAAIGPVTIHARKTDTDANILANPRIRARNREKAKILIGERVPNITTTSTSTGFVAESVNYVDVGLKLDVEPTIYLDGEVAIKVALEVSNIISQLQTKSGSIAYQIGTRTAQTVLRLKDGENQVLAGLINDEDRRSANKVPALGEVPVVGRLFGNQADEGAKTEIVLSITPRIIRNISRPDASTLEFDSGTENSLGPRPTLAPATIAPAAGGAQPHGGEAPPSVRAPVSAAPANTAPALASESQTPPAAASGAVSARWQGPVQAKVGDIFALQLVMQSDQPLVSVPLAVGFDPRTLQVTSVLEGEFLRQGGGHTTFASRVDPSGQVLITGTRAGDSGATSTGVFVTLNFRVTATPAPEARIPLLTIAPIALGGRSAAVAPTLPHVLRVVN
jgi:general secretion pathway protein D